MQGSRSRHPQRVLLGAALVPGFALACILGRVRAASSTAEIRARYPGNRLVKDVRVAIVTLLVPCLQRDCKNNALDTMFQLNDDWAPVRAP
jgi:hypothetical protein